MVKKYVPDRGDIIKLSFDPQKGREQAGWRPALVLSPVSYNSKLGLAVMCPITNSIKGYPFEVLLPEKLKTSGVVLSDYVKNLDWSSRGCRFVEKATASVVSEVQAKLATLTG